MISNQRPIFFRLFAYAMRLSYLKVADFSVDRIATIDGLIRDHVDFRKPRQGMVLFVVVIVILLTTLSAYSFALLMRTEHQAAVTRGDQMKLKSIADSGLDYLLSLARTTRFERYANGGLHDNQQLFRGVMVDDKLDRIGQFSILSAGDQPNQAIRFGIMNESAKLHLGLVLKWESEIPGSGRLALMQLPGMTESIADAILDWIDEDSQTREFGAEGDFYQSVDENRRIKNGLPERLEELLQIRNVTVPLLQGVDIDKNFHIEQHEQLSTQQQNQFANSLGESNSQPSLFQNQSNAGSDLASAEFDALRPFGWHRLLTLHSGERNMDFYGEPRINVNQENLTELHRQLEDEFDVGVANFVVTMRQLGRATNAASAGRPEIPRPNLSMPADYEIENVLHLVNSKVAIESNDEITIYSSPIQDSLPRETTLAQLLDRLTINDQTNMPRININLAPASVLRSIPGMTPEWVDRIVDARANENANASQSRGVHAYWLVEEEIMDVNEFERIVPYITVGGDVFSAQIVAFYDEETAIHRAETLIDGTRERPAPLYYRLLNHLGRGFRLGELSDPLDSISDELNSPDFPPITPAD